jgi:hypothetical protein
MWVDHGDREDDLRSVGALLDLLRQVAERSSSVDLYPVWNGDESEAPKGVIDSQVNTPKRFPEMLGLSSENAAHRIAVVWDDDSGSHEGVYIPRRDTGSLMNHFAGGRFFPGEHHRASFRVEDDADRVSLEMRSADGQVRVEVSGRTATALPPTSIFGTAAAASAFFEPGSVGYSVTASGDRLDGVVLKTHTWSVTPLAMDRVYSSYFADESMFPAGTIAFDCALIMRNVAHEWQAGAPMYV